MYLNLAKAQNSSNKVYYFVSIQKQPAYPDEIKKFYAFIKQALKYPEIAKKNNIEGKVFANFIVEKNGTLTDIQTTRSLSPETDAEALRILRKSPRWEPALHNGVPVRVRYHIMLILKCTHNYF
ncbi:energy transducer TonB [Pedobacter sp. KACC 23697]|uniref:Energy transducer TonB n=1 Tax=Pedobacter sp. KACC 23697 TaxID=3149230 RepID=A0AAU7K543_9SPHI